MALYRSLGARPDETRGTTALEVRKDLARLFTGPGVLPGADSPLVVGTDVFAYVVRSAGWVTSRGEGDGVHLWGNDGDLTVSEADDGSSLVAPAPGLSRIDVIYALHPSADENGDATSEPVVAVRKGVEASVPVAPGLPVGGLELARNTMTSTATSTDSAGNSIAQTAVLAGVRHRAFRRVRNARTTETPIPNGTWTELGGWAQSSAAGGSPASDLTVGSNTAFVSFDGWARVRAQVSFQSSPSGNRGVRIVRNGSTVAVGGYGGGSNAGSTQPVVTEWEGPVSSGDTFTVDAFQSSGDTLNTSVSNGGTVFHIERTA